MLSVQRFVKLVILPSPQSIVPVKVLFGGQVGQSWFIRIWAGSAVVTLLIVAVIVAAVALGTGIDFVQDANTIAIAAKIRVIFFIFIVLIFENYIVKRRLYF